MRNTTPPDPSPRSRPDGRDTSVVQSVDRAIRILEMFAEGSPEPSVSEIARRLGVHKATASRLLATMADHGFVVREPGADRYRLGFGLVRLAGVAAGGLELVQQARPVLVRLADETEETANLAILDGDEVVNIDQASGSRAIVSVSWVGRRTPLHCTSNGKVLLAHLRATEQDRILAGPLERLTRHTIAEPAALRGELHEVLRRGYASTAEELEVGLSAVAAPIRGPGGLVIAAVSVAGPSFRVTSGRLSALGALVRRAGDEISRRMGYAERSGSSAR